MRASVLIPALAAALALTAAAPSATTTRDAAQQPPGGVDHEAELTADSPVEYLGEEATGAINAWTHLSLWDGNTCYSDSPDNPCDRILVYVPEGGEATFTMTPNYEPADYDLVVFESGKSGEAFSQVAHEQNETEVAGEGPIPLPGPESVTFDARDDGWYLAVVFYRAAGGGYTLTGELA